GVAATLDFIQREDLGPYDVFTLQVLPGTETRRQVAEYQIQHQSRPPYYVLGTDRLAYAELRRLRRELKLGAGFDPDEVEGCPPPRLDTLQIADCRLGDAPPNLQCTLYNSELVDRLWLVDEESSGWDGLESVVGRLHRHVDIIARWKDAGRLAGWLARAIAANPSTLFDCYLLADV